MRTLHTTSSFLSSLHLAISPSKGTDKLLSSSSYERSYFLMGI